MIQISIVNKSALYPDADLPILANALHLQVGKDFYPEWGVSAQIFWTPSKGNPTASHWVLMLLDDADQAGELGVHDITPQGLPLGKVFVRTTQQAGDQVSVTASHELLEMLADPAINLTAEVDDTNGPSLMYAYEVCDPCEGANAAYEIEIPQGWAGAGQKVLVSDFVLPAYFESFRTTGPFDFQNKITTPFQILTNGYLSFLDLKNLAAGWQQQFGMGTGAKAMVKGRPHAGSRRERRRLPRSQWIRSTYSPGTDMVSAGG